MCGHLALHGGDLGVERGQYRDLAADRGRIRRGHRWRLGQLLGAQGSADLVGTIVHVPAPSAPQRPGDLGPGQPGRRRRVGCLAEQLERITAGQVLEGIQGAGEELPQGVAKPLSVAVRSQINVLCARATTLIASASSLSPVTWRSW